MTSFLDSPCIVVFGVLQRTVSLLKSVKQDNFTPKNSMAELKIANGIHKTQK